jgi:F-type H+-transporting ATPase subunit a
MTDPIEQFQIVNVIPLAKIGATTFAFTNSAFYMALTVGVTATLMFGAIDFSPCSNSLHAGF